jgi:sugar lactone lactonase YvrE
VIRSLATGEEKTFGGTGARCWVSAVWAHDSKSFLNGSFLEANGRMYRLDLSTMSASDVRIPYYKPANAVSPDEKTLYMTAHNQKEKKTSIVAVDLASGEQKSVWVAPFTVDPDTLVPQRLAMSPDGRTLALILSDGKKSHLVRVGVDGAGYRVLYSAEGSGVGGAALSRSGLAWTKDGRSILFMDSDKTGQRLLRIAADGGKPEFTGLTIGEIDAVFDLTPDGGTLAFHSPRAPTISR